ISHCWTPCRCQASARRWPICAAVPPPAVVFLSQFLNFSIPQFLNSVYPGGMRSLLTKLAWFAVAAVAAICFGGVAIYRGEHINSLWLVLAALCIYALGFRFYGKFIAARVMALDDRRATPAQRLHNGPELLPTNRWIVLGHHFAAIAGPGPLVGPVLAAQFGYLPGTLWIIAGGVLGAPVPHFVFLFPS